MAALRSVYASLTKTDAPPESSPPPAAPSAGAGAALDADLAALAAEDADRAATAKAGRLRVTHLGTGVMWITPRGAANDPPPSTVAVALARGVVAGDADTPRTKHVLRVTPFDAVVAATTEKICEGMRPLIEAAFPSDPPPLSTAVHYDHRASPGSPHRDELTAAVAALVPEGHPVKLKNPDRALVVHAIRGVAGLAVVPDYRALARLNLRELAAPGATTAACEAAAARNAAQRRAEAKQEAGQEVAGAKQEDAEQEASKQEEAPDEPVAAEG